MPNNSAYTSLDVVTMRPAKFPFCTALAGAIAVLGTISSVWWTAREISAFAPGTGVRFVLGGVLIAAMTFLFTCAWALGGMLVERRFLLNTLFVCIAVAAFPLSSYTLHRMAAERGVILKP